MMPELQINCADDALETAGTILRGRIAQIFELRDAVIESDDIEAVHDMRVVTRRIRSAMRDLNPLIDRDYFADFVSRLKSLADSLGEARDLDVSIVALTTMAEKTDEPTVRDGIASLIEDRRRQRNAVQPPLVESISSTALTDLLISFNGVFTNPAATVANISFGQAGGKAVERSIADFNALSDSLYKPSQVERLHQLRIAAKRLRYAVEFFGVCWGKRVKPFAKEVAAMQTFLGELHDADIWIEKLNREPHDHLNRWLMAEFFKIRTLNHRGAFELWGNWRSDNLIRGLRKLVED